MAETTRSDSPPACPHQDFSADQAAAWTAVAALLTMRGVDLARATSGKASGPHGVTAVLGKAGSGKTHLLATLVADLTRAGATLTSPDARKPGGRSFAVLAPTNKAASVLRMRGVPATTLHRMLYRPVFAEDYQNLVNWLSGEGKGEPSGTFDAEVLRRAKAAFDRHGSVVGALAVAGLSGSDFISGWKRRDETLDIGCVDEASMLHDHQLDDLKELFPSLVLFGDPAQLGPVKGTGMVVDKLPQPAIARLETVHRQAAGNPIVRLAHALADPALTFEAFEHRVRDAAETDDRVEVAPRMDADLMARSPALVWRNATRARLVAAFRQAFSVPEGVLVPGEPLVCDGIELPAKEQNKRVELEARGLIRGTQAVFLRAGKRRGFIRVHIVGADDPRVSCAAIVRLDGTEGSAEPWLPFAARMGAVFVHGAALTIHKAQGSQWPVVQIFAPDLKAAARAGHEDAGLPLWKRLAYVALTRAQERVRWVVFPRLARPTGTLDVTDLPG